MDSSRPTKTILLMIIFLLTLKIQAQDKKTVKMESAMTEIWEPAVEVVTPGQVRSDGTISAPSDAIVLFDGTDLSSWQGKEGGSANWLVHDGVFTVNKGAGDIVTKQCFEDFQLHIEWQVPKEISGESQYRGNSGIFLQNKYEIQLLDSYRNNTYINGQAGSIYKQTPPLKNAMVPPGQWNIYDIIYTAPRFKENGMLFSPGRVTLIHNGVVIQNNTQITGHTPNTGLPKYTAHGPGPIKLQDHNDPSAPLHFRNIWIREM